jgi:hypothetical protein
MRTSIVEENQCFGSAFISMQIQFRIRTEGFDGRKETVKFYLSKKISNFFVPKMQYIYP